MSKAAVYVRRQFAVDQKLREHFTRCCSFVPDPEIKSKRTESGKAVTKPCLALGICICTKHVDAAYFFANMSLYLKKVFWNKPKQKLCSPARSLLESYLIVLELFSGHDQSQPLPVCNADSCVPGDDWDAVFADFQAREDRAVQCSRLFLHIGRINFQSWHFGVLRLDQAAGADDTIAQDVVFLQPHHSSFDLQPEQMSTYSDVEVFAHLMNLEQSWTLRFYHISMAESDWVAAPPFSIAVRLLPDTSDFIVWQGSASEKERRSMKDRKKRAKTTKKPTATRPAKRRKKRDAPALEAGEEAVTGRLDAFSDGSNPNDDNDNDDDFMENKSLAEILLPGGCIFEDDEDQDQEDNIDESEHEDKDPVKPTSNASSLSPRSDIDLFLESASENHDDGDDDSSKQQAPAEPEQQDMEEKEAPVIPPEGAVAHIERPLGVARSTINRDVFEVEAWGELHYYHLTEQMVAFCSLRHSTHPACRKQMTTNPTRARSSGRPIGFLVAWLRSCGQHESKHARVHCALPTWQERVDARRYFMSLEGSEAFAKYEKDKNPRDDPEPRYV